MGEYQYLTHTFEPVFDKDSRILILGSFPSVKSRENNFYYGHPQNRFWKVLARVFEAEIAQTIEEKKAFLLEHNIAVWDVIEKIYVNGGKAYELYHKYAEEKTGIKAIKLPSTSPANAAWSLEKLCDAWKGIK